MIYLLSVIGLTPSGSNAVHTNNTQNITMKQNTTIVTTDEFI